MKTKKKVTKKTTLPLVSVVMPVYNAAPYLSAAIDSILNQTYKKIELLMIDDASTDNSYTIMKQYARKYPRKIKIMQNCHHHSLASVISKIIVKAKGTFIARMDADDISLPQRIEKQVAYLLKHKKTVAIGTQCVLIDQNNALIGEKTFPTKFQDIYTFIYSFCPIQHPTLMIAANRLPKNFTFYNVEIRFAEDVDLLFRLFQYGKVENLPEHLFMYRLHGKNITTTNMRDVFFMTLETRIKAVFLYGYRPPIKGIFVTLAQTAAMLLLPSLVNTWIYTMVRKVHLQPILPMAVRIAKAV